jgi:hypothetical protein
MVNYNYESLPELIFRPPSKHITLVCNVTPNTKSTRVHNNTKIKKIKNINK